MTFKRVDLCFTVEFYGEKNTRMLRVPTARVHTCVPCSRKTHHKHTGFSSKNSKTKQPHGKAAADSLSCP